MNSVLSFGFGALIGFVLALLLLGIELGPWLAKLSKARRHLRVYSQEVERWFDDQFERSWSLSENCQSLAEVLRTLPEFTSLADELVKSLKGYREAMIERRAERIRFRNENKWLWEDDRLSTEKKGR